MSSSRDAPTKPDSVAFDPATKREFFHACEVLRHRRGHHDDRGEDVGRLGRPLRTGRLQVLGGLLEVLRRGLEEVGVRERLAEGDLAVAVEIGLDALGRELLLRAEDRRLGDEEEVAGLLVLLARLRRDREGNRVLRVARVAARVDDHVVVGELGDARDDALHLLVGGVRRAEVGLELRDDGRDLVGVRGEQPVVVEVDALGEVVVPLGALAQLAGLRHQQRGVVGQIGLDRAVALGVLRRRRGRGAAPGGVLLVGTAGGHQQRGGHGERRSGAQGRREGHGAAFLSRTKGRRAR